jgi:hypothetical protein
LQRAPEAEGPVHQFHSVESRALTLPDGTECPITIDADSELMIRDVAVVEDPLRSQWTGGTANPSDGAWSFGRLMTHMAGNNDPEQFVRTWMQEWTAPRTVNGLVVPSRQTGSHGQAGRRLIQLKIEREAVKREKDEASKKRLSLIEDEIRKQEKEYADLEEVWKAEKATVQGAAHVKEEIDHLRAQMPTCNARASSTRWPRSSTASCPNWNPNSNRPRRPERVSRNSNSCAPRWALRKSPKW